jgi:hypothetical protein
LPISTTSCKATADSIKVINGDFSTPELCYFVPESNRVLALRFTEPVTVENIHVTRADTGRVVSTATREETDDQTLVSLELSEPTTLGTPYRVSGIVTDRAGNSLDFSIAFSGYNDSVPRLVLSEIRSEATKPKYEFIELYALSDGNLAGVTLFSANDGNDGIYEFPAAEVKRGEYIVVHYRKIPTDGETLEMLVDETGDDLSASAGKETGPWRDFWANNTVARIAKSDVILLRERAGGELLDALLYCLPEKTEWKNDTIYEAAEEAFDCGLWPDGFEPTSALSSDGVTATRTIGRQNIAALAASNTESAASGAQVWLVTKTSSASPGKENSSEPYVPKAKK